jgi:hypothetical protein
MLAIRRINSMMTVPNQNRMHRTRYTDTWIAHLHITDPTNDPSVIFGHGNWYPGSDKLKYTTRLKVLTSPLDGVVVSVLATGPKGRGFKPGRGDGFLRAIKIRSTPSFGWEVKPEAPCSKILRHVKDLLTYLRYWHAKSSRLHPFLLLAGGIDRELWRTSQEFPQSASSPTWLSTLMYHLGDNNRPVGGRGSET